MIKLEHAVLPNPEQMDFAIEGMRNPLASWERSDTNCKVIIGKYGVVGFKIGNNDLDLMKRLSKAGTDHRKFMRMMPVMVRITASHTFWAEFDTYKVGTVRNSCSKMHKIHALPFDYDMFDHEGIDEVSNTDADGIFGSNLEYLFNDYIDVLECLREKFNETNEKKYWRALIEMLPMGYRITANVTLNYEVLANIYHSRKNHKLDEWREFCEWIESLPYSEIIIGGNDD